MKHLWISTIASCVTLLGCVTVAPHSVVTTPHYEHVRGNSAAFLQKEGKACDLTVLFLFKWGDRSLDSAMPDLAPVGNASLAYLTVDEKVKSYLLFSRRCTRVRAYDVRTPSSAEGKPKDTTHLASGPTRGSSRTSQRGAVGLPSPSAKQPPRSAGQGKTQPASDREVIFKDGIDPDQLQTLKRMVGRSVEVKTKGGKSLTGTLKGIWGVSIAIDIGGKKKTIQLMDVKSVRIKGPEPNPSQRKGTTSGIRLALNGRGAGSAAGNPTKVVSKYPNGTDSDGNPVPMRSQKFSGIWDWMQYWNHEGRIAMFGGKATWAQDTQNSNHYTTKFTWKIDQETHSSATKMLVLDGLIIGLYPDNEQLATLYVYGSADSCLIGTTVSIKEGVAGFVGTESCRAGSEAAIDVMSTWSKSTAIGLVKKALTEHAAEISPKLKRFLATWRGLVSR